VNTITVEANIVKALGGLTNPAVLCDTNGRALGLFSPLATNLQADELQLEPPTSIAETEQLRKERTGKPLNEILHRLGLS
jgi:hypothetical protein